MLYYWISEISLYISLLYLHSHFVPKIIQLDLPCCPLERSSICFPSAMSSCLLKILLMSDQDGSIVFGGASVLDHSKFFHRVLDAHNLSLCGVCFQHWQCFMLERPCSGIVGACSRCIMAVIFLEIPTFLLISKSQGDKVNKVMVLVGKDRHQWKTKEAKFGQIN
jgi:hypothetical protein